jgi:hypothetical protein
MRPARLVLSVLLAIAVAVLPALGGAVSVVKAVESAAAAVMVADECCEHQGIPCDSPPQHHHRGAMDDCASLAACAAKCFGYAGVAPVEVAWFDVVAVVLTVSPSPAFVSHTDPPPFPPPRA